MIILRELNKQLQDVKFMPVKLSAIGYVLVAPQEVLFTSHSQLTPCYPFLHPLIADFQPFTFPNRCCNVIQYFPCSIHLVFKKSQGFIQRKT